MEILHLICKFLYATLVKVVSARRSSLASAAVNLLPLSPLFISHEEVLVGSKSVLLAAQKALLGPYLAEHAWLITTEREERREPRWQHIVNIAPLLYT
jgi:hypothetical protein